MKKSYLNNVLAVVGILVLPQTLMAAETSKYDFVCTAKSDAIEGKTLGGNTIDHFDIKDPYYSDTISVNEEEGTYCFLSRCDSGMRTFNGKFGDEFATTYQEAEKSPDEEGDIYAVYEAINPKTNTMRLKIIFYDVTGMVNIGSKTLFSECKKSKFTDGGKH